MNDAQNLEFMNHPERLAAEERVKVAKDRIRSVQTCYSAEVILKLMPPALAELATAYEALQNIEARLRYTLPCEAEQYAINHNRKFYYAVVQAAVKCASR